MLEKRGHCPLNTEVELTGIQMFSSAHLLLSRQSENHVCLNIHISDDSILFRCFITYFLLFFFFFFFFFTDFFY